MALSLCSLGPVFADTVPAILRGKVTLPDGTPPPVSFGIQRQCNDEQGSAPGPLTNKKGEYIWRMDVDPLAIRRCYLMASAKGYSSSRLEISSLQGYTDLNIKLEDIIVTPATADPESIISNESAVPAKATPAWKAAMKAMDAGNNTEVIKNLQAVVQASPKFAQGWDTLGIVLNHVERTAEARDAFQHAIEADPKYVAAYVSLARVSIRLKDWDGVTKAVDGELKQDPKHNYIEIYLHQAVARYHMKDYDGALAAVQQCIMLDKTHALPRAEYIWGRILEAKGDLDGARQHIKHYLETDRAPRDLADVKTHLDTMGKPGATDPELEVF
ncbi:MAG TPA: hypothetical protein VGN17_07160 [Bryobacteraceae bacterium]